MIDLDSFYPPDHYEPADEYPGEGDEADDGGDVEIPTELPESYEALIARMQRAPVKPFGWL